MIKRSFLTVLFAGLCVCPLVFGESTSPVRIDTLEDVKEEMQGFARLKKDAGFATKKPLPGGKDAAFLLYTFPKPYYITKITVRCAEVFIPDFAGTTVSGMYAFEVSYLKPKGKGFTSLQKITANTKFSNKFYPEERVEAVKISLLPVVSKNTKKEVCYGEMTGFSIYGYPGDPPAPEKPNIKNKKAAGESLRRGEITSQEYIKLLKELKE